MPLTANERLVLKEMEYYLRRDDPRLEWHLSRGTFSLLGKPAVWLYRLRCFLRRRRHA
jgi:hypothetical protein